MTQKLLFLMNRRTGLMSLRRKTCDRLPVDLRAQGKTIILSTHIFSLVERICDQVGIIIDGRMVFEAGMEEFKEPNSLEKTFL